MIELQDVSVVYAKRYIVLSHISLHIEKGEFVCITGPTGSGKSTLLKLIYRAVVPTRGRVLVDGQDLSELRPRALPGLRRRMGILSPEFGLLPHKTLCENIAFVLHAVGVRPSKIERRVCAVLELVGLRDFGDAYPDQLSSGERQHAALARAWASKPSLLLADAPAGPLDPVGAGHMIQVLSRIHQSGTTVVMTAHDIPMASGGRPRRVEFEKGRLVHDELWNGVTRP